MHPFNVHYHTGSCIGDSDIRARKGSALPVSIRANDSAANIFDYLNYSSESRQSTPRILAHAGYNLNGPESMIKREQNATSLYSPIM
jgi:hypothetical protein